MASEIDYFSRKLANHVRRGLAEYERLVSA